MACTCTSRRERKSCSRRDYCEEEAMQAMMAEDRAMWEERARHIVVTLRHADAATLAELRDLLGLPTEPEKAS